MPMGGVVSSAPALKIHGSEFRRGGRAMPAWLAVVVARYRLLVVTLIGGCAGGAGALGRRRRALR